jgi:hypothetical protein
VLADQSFDITFFNLNEKPFEGAILRTTWEELKRQALIAHIGQPGQYRLTAKGWLVALECSDTSKSGEFNARVGRLCAAMKAHHCCPVKS